MREKLLLLAACLILLFIGVQLLRGLFLSRRRWKGNDLDPELSAYMERATTQGEARQVLREIDTRALEIQTEQRSRFYTTAGEISLIVLKRPTVAVRYYLRALRHDPTCESAFDRLAEVLLAQWKIRRLEHICWTLLARLNDDDVGGRMWRKCWSGLLTVYAASPRTSHRADAIRKLLSVSDLGDMAPEMMPCDGISTIGSSPSDISEPRRP